MDNSRGRAYATCFTTCAVGIVMRHVPLRMAGVAAVAWVQFVETQNDLKVISRALAQTYIQHTQPCDGRIAPTLAIDRDRVEPLRG